MPLRREEEEEKINGTIEVAMVNGDVPTPSPKRGRGRPRKESAPMLDIEMPVRVKKTSVKRPTKGDGATILTQNARYSLKMLPSTPKDLRREAIEYRGSIGAGHHALAVTRERAYVWDYTSHGPVSSPKVFDMPFAVKPTDVLPFGALVATGASTEIGLVLISATSGKVVYYESVERAASLGLFQERNVGVEGSLGSLFSSETVMDIVSAHHAGFVIILNSGRIAQLTLRDAQGKARVFAQFLRATDQGSGGLFGSIKGFLGTGAWKKDVAAVRTRPLGTRGQMQVISLTARAELQIWDLDWSGQYRFKSTVDFREVLGRELKKVELPELQDKEENVTALDFAILEPPSDTTAVAIVGSELPLDILVLLRVGSLDNHEHVLAGMIIEGQEVMVPQVLLLSAYHGHSAQRTQNRPRLLLPKPKHTALVALEDAIVVKQMDESEANSPEAQLHASYVQPATFEDSIHLRHDRDFAVLGAYEEDDKGSQESVVLFVKGAGLVRVSVVDPKSADQEEKISIKSKIEQAVFHGALQGGNIIDFSRIGDSPYSPDEVEEAALSISDEIFRSTSPFISTSPTSMDMHFTYKAQALRALVIYIRQNFPTLSKAASWQLLWDAERVAAAQQIWKAFEDQVTASSQTKRTATVLDEVCAAESREPDSNAEEVVSDDVVRNFFVYKLHRMDRLLTKIRELLRVLKEETDETSETKIRSVMQADDLWNKALETVFAFRNDNGAAYGILPEFMEDGVLTDEAEYSELPEFWTSTEPMLKAVIAVAELSREFARTVFERNENGEAGGALEPMILQINTQNPRLIQLLCLIYQERIKWLDSRPSERDRELAEKLRINYDHTRNDHLRDLATVAQSRAGIQMAEKYKDMRTLTEMVLAEVQFASDELNEAEEHDKPQIQKYADELSEKIGTYFDRFGDDWANAYFDEGFSGTHAGVMLRDAQEKFSSALTKYLRADPSRAKISWINDITARKDFGRASQSLILTAKDQETKLWAKKVELSLGKLSLLATQEDLTAKGVAMTERDLQNAIPHGELDIVAIQEQLYWHLVPEIIHCIDHQAEVEVAMQKFADKLQDLHSLRQLLETYLDRVLDQVVLSADELIDVLTLLDNVVNENVDNRNLHGEEFFLALKALNAIAPGIPQDRFETLLQLIWKRCYVYDNWVEINNRQKQSDVEITDKLRQTAPWRTLYHAHDQGLFGSPDCHVRHLLPSECLGAGCKPEDLSYRWSNQDLLDPILHDNRIQDEQLDSYVTDRNLDQWIKACDSDVKATLEEKAEEKAQMLEREREFEVSVQQAKTNGDKVNGHVLNGTFKVENNEDEDGGILGSDVDEDVDMA